MTDSVSGEGGVERGERLNRYMARAGVASRRKADDLIAQKRVAVNGVRVESPATFVDAERDTVTVDGKALAPPPTEKIWILMNKASGLLTARRDQRGRSTVFDGLPPVYANLIPVGRLDYDTEGLLLLTNDGGMANRLMHPRYRIEKVYEAVVDGVPTRGVLRRLRDGIDLGDRTPARAEVSILGRHETGTVLRLVLREGRKREVKRMCEAIGHRVRRLRRVSFAGMTLKGVELGGWRRLSDAEIRKLEALPQDPE